MKRFFPGFMLLIIFLLVSGCGNPADEEENTVNGHDDEPETIGASDDSKETELPEHITIEGNGYDQIDIAYFTLFEKIKIEMARFEDIEEKNKGEAAERNSYWDDQLKLYENENIRIQNLIELVSMALLAEEKNYFIPDERLQKELDEWHEKTAGAENARQLIEEADKDVYNRKLKEYFRLSMLRDRVVDDLQGELQEDNPQWTSEELNYALGQSYQDLYMDQLSSIEIEVNIE